MRFRLLPTDDKFFELFDLAAANVADCVRRMHDVLEGKEGAHEAVIACEQRGDELTRTILQRLHTSFVTPFDREDIHALAEELDDVVDDVLDFVYRLQLGKRDPAAVPELLQQADVLVECSDEVVKLVGRLPSMKNVAPHLEAVDRLESKGDVLYRQALERLYSGEMKALAVLHWKDLIEALERALNTLEDVSNVVEAIVLKHA